MTIHDAKVVETCGRCGHRFEATTNMTGDERPKPDDFSVCIQCGAVTQFDAELRHVPISDDRLRELKDQEPELWASVQMVRLRLYLTRRGVVRQSD